MLETLEKGSAIDDESGDTSERHPATDRDSPAVTLCYNPQRVFVCLCHTEPVRRMRRTGQRGIRRSRGFFTWGIYAS